jgi:hypothetical protein
LYELENCPNLEEIELFGCIYLTDNGLMVISKRCPKLRKVNISDCPELSGKSIRKIISSHTKLVEFIAVNCPQAIDDEVCNHIVDQLSMSLEKLDLSHCKLSEGATINISSCTKLKCLHLSGCQVTDRVIAEYSKVC